VNWKLLVLKKAVMGRIPFGNSLRRWKRSRFGYAPNAANMDCTLENYGDMKRTAEAAGASFLGGTVLEIGSGWFPVIPVLLCLEGAKQVLMSDLSPHMDDVTFGTAVRELVRRFPDRTDLRGISHRSQLPIKYLAPLDVAKIEDNSLDFIISRTVLEHIPEAELTRLFNALRPKLKPSGHMVHLIDHSDHLEHQDKSITRIHFLTWSAGFHAALNRLIKEGENRLRHHEYRRVFERAGYAVAIEEGAVHEGTRRRCGGLALAPPYDGMSAEQLSILTSIYVLRPRA